MGTTYADTQTQPKGHRTITVSPTMHNYIKAFCLMYYIGMIIAYIVHGLFYSLYSGIMLGFAGLYGLILLYSIWKLNRAIRNTPADNKSYLVSISFSIYMNCINEILQLFALVYQGYTISVFLRSSKSLSILAGLLIVFFTLPKIYIWYLYERPTLPPTTTSRVKGEIASMSLGLLVLSISYFSRFPDILSHFYHDYNTYYYKKNSEIYKFFNTNDSLVPFCELLQGIGILWCLLGIQARIKRSTVRIAATSQPVTDGVCSQGGVYPAPPNGNWTPQGNVQPNPNMQYYQAPPVTGGYAGMPQYSPGRPMAYPEYPAGPGVHAPQPFTPVSATSTTPQTQVFYGAMSTPTAGYTAYQNAPIAYPNPGAKPFSAPLNNTMPSYPGYPNQGVMHHVQHPNAVASSYPVSPASAAASTNSPITVGFNPLPSINPVSSYYIGVPAPNDDLPAPSSTIPTTATKTTVASSKASSYLALIFRVATSTFAFAVLIMELTRRGSNVVTEQLQAQVPSVELYLDLVDCDEIQARPPWFSSWPHLISCNEVILNCQDHEFSQAQMTAIFRALNPETLTGFHISNCKIHQVPAEIKYYNSLSRLEFVHVQIEDWQERAALTSYNHPSLMFLSFDDVSLPNDGSIPPGLTDSYFPYVSSLEFYRTPIKYFTQSAGHAWRQVEGAISIEYCNVSNLPESLFERGNYDYGYYYGYSNAVLSLVGNQLAQVPSQIFNGYYKDIHLDLNPFTELPDSFLEGDFDIVSVTGTQLQSWPMTMEHSTLPFALMTERQSYYYYYDTPYQPTRDSVDWYRLFQAYVFVASETPLCATRPVVTFDSNRDELLYNRMCLDTGSFTGYLPSNEIIIYD